MPVRRPFSRATPATRTVLRDRRARPYDDGAEPTPRPRSRRGSSHRAATLARLAPHTIVHCAPISVPSHPPMIEPSHTSSGSRMCALSRSCAPVIVVNKRLTIAHLVYVINRYGDCHDGSLHEQHEVRDPTFALAECTLTQGRLSTSNRTRCAQPEAVTNADRE